MHNRHIFLIALLALITIGLTACGGSKYLMKGLTLPPGSTEVSVTDSIHSGMGGMMPPGIGGKVKKSITVEFNCSGGWGTVTSHFDSFMRGKGYEDSMQAADAMTGSAMPGGMKMSDMMRSYMKMGEKYSVSIMNNQAMMGMAGGGSAQSMGMSDFMLMVIEYE